MSARKDILGGVCCAQHYLAKDGIFAVRRVKKSDMENLSLATGATVMDSCRMPSRRRKCRGSTGCRGKKLFPGNEVVVSSKCEGKAGHLLGIRGGCEHMVDDGLGQCHPRCAHGHKRCRTGRKYRSQRRCTRGIEISFQLHRYTSTLGGQIQLAIEAFAKALEVIPRALDENAGLDYHRYDRCNTGSARNRRLRPRCLRGNTCRYAWTRRSRTPAG